ncbi:MAG: hypothetical protein UX99_C0003G0008 [Candidatus Amesbacteria bacterium GW2011_GWB1_47_26]|uniref:Uncharacterized protein n=1 Tax=Candidatus Amesbacteria bacterium GW2011_GWC2_45_19 TaxID=1618366 RepID=A0A0G1M4M8_9BACT|nr:MAG: hypothetical protein UX05_C0003G0008 [Candidatus Amesbacteria bacterium GW2011_GWC2_45_19]KKU38628.1 MAG: hypothetical protein UX52_C0002G0008 [Candidatus Amesbacteria bacterium GW2011_GWA1_46_35]KKU68668.1 MAG: hypothetical protein UX93_C0006G0085 [Microgenomates group bacterium GW2011_GWC1_47_20]KKU74948.1 MAG: hypothetical protein UX99_C0003G0008 [Candidatus Amesbacteria bacterium GW2011_GWB1_47_26]KKU80247.1 MAG: hypothetical protein UY06_C0003G0009 [Candidatus Amesbacteria bacteriu
MGAGGSMEVKKWSWLAFPLLVGVMTVVSFGKLVAGPDQIWRKLRLNEGKAKATEIEVVKLKSKLDRLNRVDTAEQGKVLSELGKAVPSQIQPMLLIGEMNQAASESGVAVEKYRIDNSETRQALQVSILTEDAGKLIDWVNNMEGWLPLARIVGISYENDRAEVTVEQVWKESAASGTKPEDELPETGERVKSLLSKLGDFREIGTSSAQTKDDGAVNPNPF